MTTISHYHQNAAHYRALYDALDPARVHANWRHLMPATSPGAAVRHALDVGAGSGRDAAWLHGLGWQVTAVEPAAALRQSGIESKPDGIRWLDDQLPALQQVQPPSMGFDLILLSAVWMHLTAPERTRAFERLQGLLAAGGVLIITLRHGASDPDRPMYPVRSEELSGLGRQYDLDCIELAGGLASDLLQRESVHWQTVAIRKPKPGE